MDLVTQFFVWLNSLFAPANPSLTQLVYSQTPYGVAMPNAIKPTRTSSRGIAFLKAREAFRAKPYGDAGKWAIGYGHQLVAGDGLTTSSVLDEEAATRLLLRDLISRENAINSKVTVPLTQNQYDALVSLIYNIGIGAFGSSTLLRKLNARDYRGAANEFMTWENSQGKPILRGRRELERTLFLTA
jgi:lysozyme